MKFGVVYACSDVRWFEETVLSAMSVAHFMPRLAREFYAPEELINNVSIPPNAFTKVVALKSVKVAHRPRFEALMMTGLDVALFLDGDTMLTEPIPEVFGILEHFDIGLTIAPQLHAQSAIEKGLHEVLPKVSLALPEYNSGFFLARVDDRFRAFTKNWLGLFERSLAHGIALDQPSLRIAVATSDLRVAVLPNNYNFRANTLQSVVGKVKVLHAHANLPEIAKSINQKHGFRCYQPSDELVYGFRPKAFQKRDG
ncbi:hypothetical protein [Aestuariivirga sp.]|uniref:hypothetical protein n=1 Tax=Aestuariivirga sp. TaxID=2650926 RepID=UPI0039E5D07B